MIKGLRITAFSMAEVMITLAIIGIVFMLLKPFIEAIHERGWQVAKVATQERFVEGLRQMDLNVGLESFSDTAAFVNTLTTKYFKVAKVCSNSEIISCMPQVKNYYGTPFTQPLDASGIWNGDSSYKSIGIVLASGVTMNLAYKPCISDDSVCIGAIIDVNGNSQPNRMGRDAARLLVSKGNDDKLTIGVTPTEITPNDVPYTFVGTFYDEETGNTENNYWAGANAACSNYPPAGTWHLPNKSEMLAMYLDNNKYGSNEAGFKGSGYWSSTEYSSSRAAAYYFFTGWHFNLYKGTQYNVRCVR